jgi:RHS repeat-associated protein
MAMIGPYCGKGDNPWLFAGKRHDSSGLINFGRRYYNPEFGRWITCDPQGFTDGPNLYAYVNNNPLTHFDEYGLFDGYWDCTPEESAMYNPEAQYRGMANAATAVFTGARDFFFGSTYELGASIHSEFWGNPNDPNRVTPISQRSWSNIGLLAGGAAIELSPAKVIGLGGRTVKWLGKGAMKISYVKNTAKVGKRFFQNSQKVISQRCKTLAGLNYGRSAKQGDLLKTHLRQLEEYGKDSFKRLQNGRFRYYKDIANSRTPGEMMGRRLVREWDPATGLKRTWNETLDHNKNIRIVRPQFNNNKNKTHYLFDRNGEYRGTR